MRDKMGGSIAEAIAWAKKTLSGIADAQFEAECLLAAILQVDRIFLKTHPGNRLSASAKKTLQAQVQARQGGYPLAYLLGKKAFWTFELTITPDVLIPRADTERLIEVLLSTLPRRLAYPVLELGTGSGAIALALASERPDWRIIATDRSAAALGVAQANALALQQGHIQFCQGAWFEALQGQGPFSAIVSNPPYIAQSDPHLQDPALQAEPQSALCAGETGLEALRHLIQGARAYLPTGGLLCLEHGHDQSADLFALLTAAAYRDIEQFFDLGGVPRVITAIV